VPTTTTAFDVCPQCQSVLVCIPDAERWCGVCEWNLDFYEPRQRTGWVWNRIIRWDHRAGFQADRLLAELSCQDQNAPIPPGAFRFLVGVSAVLMLTMLVAFFGGVLLLVEHTGFWHVVAGLALPILALTLLPRFGRLKKLLEPGYRVPDDGAPALRGLIERIAGEIGAPVPDVLAFDFSWNAIAVTVGVRQTRVLVLGVRLLLALQPQELVALLGHELGHFGYGDSERILLTRPALTVFGAYSRALRPRRGDPVDLAMQGPIAIGFQLWRLVAGTLSILLWGIHIGLNLLDARRSRRVELRADLAAVRAAGTAATLGLVDVLAQIGSLGGYIQHHVPTGEAAATWRRMLASVRTREAPAAPIVRQHSIRAEASLLASHPSPGRRHQWLAGLPATAPTVVLDDMLAVRIRAETDPYAEAMHATMLDYVTE
jgi:Zn-dependent protease with chaperone function